MGRGLISIHAPREGCDLQSDFNDLVEQVFQSTHPVRGATSVVCCSMTAFAISIHAPREGCDNASSSSTFSIWNFNPRTP